MRTRIQILAPAKLAAAAAAVLAAVAFTLTSISAAQAYEQPLNSESIREAYFLGQRGDEATARFLAQYVQTFPVPGKGPHIQKVSVLTPYAQVVLRSSQQRGVGTVFDAADQYRASANLFLVRVTIFSTPTFQWPKLGGRTVPEFQIRAIQEHELKLLKPAPTQINTHGKGSSGGTELELEFDAAQVTAAPIVIEVKSPDGQRVVAKFDLEKLK